MSDQLVPQSSVILYQADDGRIRIDVRFDGETVWLTQQLMADLFQTTQQNISLHLQNIYEEGELQREATHKESLSVRQEGTRQVQRRVDVYNLDAILSVGYRVKSAVATRFRIWVTERLREYIVKGFTMDDERLKDAHGYFDELLSRIRDIRSSEKIFWRKVLDIYALSADYDPHDDMSQKFFATVQNKMHWAAHGHTAAEIIAKRADGSKPNMGMTAWAGGRPRRTDASVAKNYLTEKEVGDLNLIVSLFLDFAELQARGRRVMKMSDWIGKLDDFMRLSDREVLTHAGRVTHEAATARADEEFEKLRRIEDAKPTPVEKHFLEAIEQVKKLEKGKRSNKLKL